MFKKNIQYIILIIIFFLIQNHTGFTLSPQTQINSINNNLCQPLKKIKLNNKNTAFYDLFCNFEYCFIPNLLDFLSFNDMCSFYITALTNPELKKIANSNILWKKIFKKDFGQYLKNTNYNFDQKTDWKTTYAQFLLSINKFYCLYKISDSQEIDYIKQINENCLAILFSSGDIDLIDIQTSKKITIYNNNKDSNKITITFPINNTSFITVSEDNMLKIWIKKKALWKCSQTFFYNSNITSITKRHVNNIVIGFQNNTLKVLKQYQPDFYSGYIEKRYKETISINTKNIDLPEEHSGITNLLDLPDNNIIASSVGQSLIIRNSQTFSIEKTIDIKSTVFKLFSTKKNIITIITSTGILFDYNIKQNHLIKYRQTTSEKYEPVNTTNIENTILLIRDKNKDFRIYNLETCQELLKEDFSINHFTHNNKKIENFIFLIDNRIVSHNSNKKIDIYMPVSLNNYIDEKNNIKYYNNSDYFLTYLSNSIQSFDVSGTIKQIINLTADRIGILSMNDDNSSIFEIFNWKFENNNTTLLEQLYERYRYEDLTQTKHLFSFLVLLDILLEKNPKIDNYFNEQLLDFLNKIYSNLDKKDKSVKNICSKLLKKINSLKKNPKDMMILDEACYSA